MQSMIEQLDRESGLMMYLAGELPEVDRAEMERRLAGDESLRAELEQLRLAQDVFARSIALVDEAQPLHLSAAANERSIGRLIRQWQVDRVAEQARRAAVQPSRSGWGRMRIAATAAALFLGFLVWWGLQTGGEPPTLVDGSELPGNIVIEEPSPALALGPGAGAGGMADSAPDFQLLRQAEHDLDAVAYLRTLTE